MVDMRMIIYIWGAFLIAAIFLSGMRFGQIITHQADKNICEQLYSMREKDRS